MSNWPEYVSHKVIRAMPITDILPDGTILVGDDRELFEPTVPAMADKAEIGGYAMLYPDGFKSISPRKAFEDGYRLKE